MILSPFSFFICVSLNKDIKKEIHTHIQKKEGLIFRLILLLSKKTAATYSPTFTQYHRRGWA